MVRPFNKVHGHALLSYGRAHDGRGNLIEDPKTDDRRRTYGRAWCACGKHSRYMWGNANRKAWFEKHKKALLKEKKELKQFEKSCTVCGETKTVDRVNKKQSDFRISYDTRNGKEVEIIAGQCRPCANRKSREEYNREADKNRRQYEKTVAIHAVDHIKLRKLALQKQVTNIMIVTKAVRFYLNNFCPSPNCIEVSIGGYMCQKCLKER